MATLGARHPGLAVIKNETRIVVRSSRWIALLLVFAALDILAYYTSSTNNPVLAQAFPLEIDGILHTIPIGIPIAGILMGFDLVSGEIETNSLPLVLSCPIGRQTLLLSKFSARFLLAAVPTIVAPLVAYLVSGQAQDFNSEFGVRFGILELILLLGLLFWLGISSLISAATKRSTASLLYSVILLPFLGFGISGSGTFTDIIASLIFQGPLPLGGGFANLPIYFETTKQFSVAVYARYFVPQQAILAPATGLFNLNQHAFLYSSLWDWFTTYAGYNTVPPVGGFPSWVPLLYMALLSAAFLSIGVRLFKRTDA